MADPAGGTLHLLRRAAEAFATNDLVTADALARQFVERDSKSSDGWRLVGRIRTRQSRFDEAEEAFLRADRLAPRDAEVPFGRGQLFLRQGRYADALRSFEEALRRNSAHPEASFGRAEALRASGDVDRALTVLGTPTTPGAWLILGECLAQRGDPGGAQRALDAGLALGPDATTGTRLQRRLGEVFESQGEFARALTAYRAAKSLSPARFDWHQFRSRCERIRSFFSGDFLSRAPRATVRTRRPIFIASMPRSGTTLLERQIAAHPLAAGAGETEALHRQVESWADPAAPSTSWPLCVRGFLPRDLDAMVEHYAAATERYASGGVTRVADKHLSNWMYVGLIAMAFPEATIVHLERDPIDTGLSCFERLQNSAMPWAATLEGVGAMLASAEQLMAHWHEVLPGRMVRVRYEELVRDPRRNLTPVLEAAGLSWDDACLAHQRPRAGRNDPPPTLSAEQAAKPIYDASIGRAARFGAALDPLREAYARARR